MLCFLFISFVYMNYLTYTYSWKSRDLKKIIVALFKSGVAISIKKVNYVQNYRFKDDKIEKSEEKMIVICTEDEVELADFLSKNFPQIERFYLK